MGRFGGIRQQGEKHLVAPQHFIPTLWALPRGALGTCDLGLTMSWHHLLVLCLQLCAAGHPPCTLSPLSHVLVRINEQKNLVLCLICRRARVANNP